MSSDARDGASSYDLGAPADAGTVTDPRDQPGAFVILGNHVRHVRSLDDGATWVDDATLLPSSLMGEMYGIRTVSWLNGKFVAYAAKVYTSPEGNTWTEIPKSDPQWIGCMVYAQGHYVSSGGSGWLATTTTDLGTWMQHPPTSNYSAPHHARNGLAFGDVGGGSYVVTNDDGNVFHSADAFTWSPSSGIPASPIGGTMGLAVAYGGGVFVVISSAGTTPYRSTDGGATFTAAGTFSSAAAGLIYAQGHFTALAEGHVYTSVDGASWQDRAEPTAHRTDSGLAYGHGTYVGVSQAAMFRRSTDGGMTWSTVYTAPSNTVDYFSWIAFGPGVR